MKKYIKPEIEIVSFDVQSAVMAYAAETDMLADGAIVELSANTMYIPDSVDKKVWGTMEDGENWNWDE